LSVDKETVTIQPSAGESAGNFVKAFESKKSSEITLWLNSYQETKQGENLCLIVKFWGPGIGLRSGRGYL
jgi:hypothetical protein